MILMIKQHKKGAVALSDNPLLWFVWRGSFAENSHSCKKNDIFIQQIVKKFKPSRQTNHEPRQTT